MRTVSSGHQQDAGNNSDFSAFLLGAALRAAHFFPFAIASEPRWSRFQRWRSLFVFLSLVTLGGILALHLYVLEFDPRITSANLTELNRRWHSYDTPQGKRGNILYRDGTLLAGNCRAGRIIVEPGMVAAEDKSGLCAWLARATGQETNKLLTKVLRRDAHGVIVADGLALEQAQEIDRAHQPGVFVRYYFQRCYPHGEYGAATTVGYCGREQVHRLGLEKTWDTPLTGHDGRVDYARDRFRRRLPDTIQAVDPAPGQDLLTTLDPSVQLICETELRKAQAANHAQWGCVLVMEPRSGEVLGAATYPTFDPNAYIRGNIGNELNVITQSVVEPGSTLKPLLAAAAIDHFWVPQSRTYRCSQPLNIKGHIIREAETDEHIGGSDGIADLHEIIVHSSNIGMAQLALELGQEHVLDALTPYGLFQRTGIELPGEARGFRPNYYAGQDSRWPRVLLANSGFGQGLAVTPLQLCSAYCAIANGGWHVKPTLVLNPQAMHSDDVPALPPGETLLAGMGITRAEAHESNRGGTAPRPGKRDAGTERSTAPPTDRERILRPETSALMSQWLADAVAQGTGKKARLERFTAAGKTGTAQVPSPRGGYEAGAYTASFCGFFPARQPRYVVLVMFGKPRGAYYGGLVSAPVFKAVADRISFLQGDLAGAVQHSDQPATGPQIRGRGNAPPLLGAKHAAR